jgi:hypothetical protein
LINHGEIPWFLVGKVIENPQLCFWKIHRTWTYLDIKKNALPSEPNRVDSQLKTRYENSLACENSEIS